MQRDILSKSEVVLVVYSTELIGYFTLYDLCNIDILNYSRFLAIIKVKNKQYFGGTVTMIESLKVPRFVN